MAPFSLDIEKVLFLWDFYGIQEKYTKKTLAKTLACTKILV
ncbi:hypothetical protein [Helicobacter pylori]